MVLDYPVFTLSDIEEEEEIEINPEISQLESADRYGSSPSSRWNPATA